MRAMVELNPGSGSLAKLGIDRGRERVAASGEANNLVATIALAPASGISERIEDELSSSHERTRRRSASTRNSSRSATDTAVTAPRRGFRRRLLFAAYCGGCHGPGSASLLPVGSGAADNLPVYRQQYVPTRCVRQRYTAAVGYRQTVPLHGQPGKPTGHPGACDPRFARSPRTRS